jgi:cystathionine gamma-synthase
MGCRYPVSEVLRALRGGLRDEEPDVVPPIHVSVPYRFIGMRVKPLDEVKYSRENNPTTRLLEHAASIAEGTKWCLAFNTGMAAIAALIDTLNDGGVRNIVASKLLYGTTRSLLERYRSKGVNVTYAGPPWSGLLAVIEQQKPAAVFVETIGNPTLRIAPLDELIKICGELGCVLIVDNTFASPCLYRPAASHQHVIVVESITKYIGGHNDVMGGLVCGNDEALLEALWDTRKTYGSIMQPFDAFMAARGLKTLHVRMEYVSRSAQKIAEALEEAKAVIQVYYPGIESHPDHAYARRLLPGLYGGVLSFDVGAEEKAKRLMKRLRLVVPSPSLGGVESIIAYPYESSHRGLSDSEKAALGITRGLLRLSVGLEDPEDVVKDILTALS